MSNNHELNGGSGERLFDVPEACRRLAIGRTKLYEEMAAGRLRWVTIGRRARRIPSRDLDDYIDQLRRSRDIGEVDATEGRAA